jgi:alpha-amylase/alpha-mannosidase (GH57 family)
MLAWQGRKVSIRMNHFVCIHGHFYQPPRENPWLEAVEVQDSAAPFHDWNERVTAECYAPNSLSRILDSRGYIRKIVNNYASISFDFGPTLLSWLAENAGPVYEAVLQADRESRRRFSGHGSALAQAYNHAILPLATRRDKITQIEWGLRDFTARFGREAEGMWLPETAVDLETLDLLAERGIRFVILAPDQARRVRPPDGGPWQETTGRNLDITRPYGVDLPSGRTIAAFFYHGAIAHEISFEGLLSSGDAFAKRLLDAFRPDRPEAQLIHVATDGESYGHHHRFGDMALAYAVDRVERGGQAGLTNYGEFLARFPPQWKAEIAENTSWSCAHGVERWRSNCGCQTGQHPGWNQEWRATLREAFDSLRAELDPLYETQAAKFFRDPWSARDGYIGVILDRSAESVEAWFQSVQSRPLSAEEKTRALKLLELQRHALLIYTSCGWFFDDLAGIEARQDLQYAARAIQLAQDLFGDGVEERFAKILEKAHSNEKGNPDGRAVYGRARSERVDLAQVAAHYAVSSVFETYADRAQIYCYAVERRAHRIFEAGRTKLAVGWVTVESTLTRERAVLCYGMLHFGDQNFSVGVRPCREEKEYSDMARELSAPFLRGDFPDAIRYLDSCFEGGTYSLKDLFLDEQRKILNLVIQENLSNAERQYVQLYENHAPLLRFLRMVKMPLPQVFQATAVVALNGEIRAAMAAPPLDTGRLRALLEQAAEAEIALDGETLGYTLRNSIDRMAMDWYADPQRMDRLAALRSAVELARSLPFWVDLWRVQNIFYEVLQTARPGIKTHTGAGNPPDAGWTKEFMALGDLLQVRTDTGEHSAPGG